MPNYNKVMLMGNLTRDPEVRYTKQGTAVAEIGLAVNRRYNMGDDRREETTYVDITLWGKTAEIVEKYVGKGQPLFVEGRLQLDSWEDKQTGSKRSKLKVVGENIEFINSGGGRSNEGGGGGSRGDFAQRGGGGNSRSDDYGSSSSSEPKFEPEDDDIPF